MISNEEHVARIIDDLKGQIADRSLELASVRSVGNYWREYAEKLLKEKEAHAEEVKETEPTVHVVTTKT
jgi:hypothetical protein